MNARGRTPVAIHPCRVKCPERDEFVVQMCRYAECTTVRLPNKCTSLDDRHSIFIHKPSVQPQDLLLRTNNTTTSKALVSSHVRVDSISRSNNKHQTCTNSSRSNRQPASQPSRLPGFAFAPPGLLQQALQALSRSAATRGERAKALHFETYIHTCSCTPASAKAMQQRGGILPYHLHLLIIFLSSYRLLCMHKHAALCQCFSLLDSAHTTVSKVLQSRCNN